MASGQPAGVIEPKHGPGDHEFELAAGGAGERGAALDGDPRVLDAEPEELFSDSLAKAARQSVVAGRRRMAGDYEYAQDWAVLDDLELADPGVAGGQGKGRGWTAPRPPSLVFMNRGATVR